MHFFLNRKNSELIGSWRLDAVLDGETVTVSVEFTSDTEGVYSIEGIKNQRFDYHIENGNIITYSDGITKSETPFSVTKDALTVTYNGTDLIFTRFESKKQ